jgi:membrane protease YdiL (CAAX protease family)
VSNGETRRVRPAPGTEPIERVVRHVLRALVAVLALAAAWNGLGNLLLPSAWYVPANLAAAAAVLAIGRRSGLSVDELGLARRDLAAGVKVGLVAAAVVAVVLAIALLAPAVESFLDDAVVATDSTAMRWFRPLVRIPLGTVVFEELLFRSVLFGLLMRLRGPAAAVIGTAVLFGLWHIAPAWETAQGDGASVSAAVVGTVVVTTAAGVVFGLLRLRSNSVVAPMLAHWATNSLAYVAALISMDLIG